MGIGGGTRSGLENPNFPIAPRSPLSSFGDPASFTAAATTQASDYDKIMKGYADYLNGLKTNPLTAGTVGFKPITATTAPYSQSPDVTKSLSDLSELSTTGGFTPQGIQDIRERAISPIRSLYATQEQELERNRALMGGYSPNFAAASAKMARDLSTQIGDITTNANAQIAQDVARNRISASGTYGSAAGSANQTKTAADLANANIVNQINQANAQMGLQADTTNAELGLRTGLFNRQGTLGALQGMQSLYGTTPALTSLFGNQVMGAANLNQNQQSLTQQGLGQFLRPSLVGTA